MFDWMSFEKHDGEAKNKRVQILALKSCAFCKRGMDYLSSHDIGYEYAYIDKLAPKEKKRLKDEFKEAFGERPLFPTIIVDETEYQLGFIEKAWGKLLGVES